jgi:parallel beta-helix repeat protein
VTSATVQGNRFIGGNSLTSGQGLVIKEATNAVVTDNLVYGGYFSGLYVKGAQSPTVRRNTVINLYSTSACVRVEKNITDPGALFSNSIFTDNYVVAQIGQMFSFNSIGSGENGSGSYYDRNIYDLRGTATWGNIRGTTVSSFSGVQSAWSSYASGTNEANSIVGSGAAAFTYRHTSTVGLFPASPFAGPCIYSIIYDLKGNVWNGTSFVIYVLANHHQYVNWLIEATPGSYRFITKVPLGLPAGDYIVETLSTTSLLATSADTKLGSEVFSWDGISRFSNQYLGVRAAQIKNNLLI